MKREELEWALDGVREERARLDSGESGHLADRSAYCQLVQHAPEWPFTGSAFVRVVFYLLLPLAAWTAGALLETLLEAFLQGL